MNRYKNFYQDYRVWCRTVPGMYNFNGETDVNDYDFEPINRKMRPFSKEPFLNVYVNKYNVSEPRHIVHLVVWATSRRHN